MMEHLDSRIRIQRAPTTTGNRSFFPPDCKVQTCVIKMYIKMDLFRLKCMIGHFNLTVTSYKRDRIG